MRTKATGEDATIQHLQQHHTGTTSLPKNIYLQGYVVQEKCGLLRLRGEDVGPVSDT